MVKNVNKKEFDPYKALGIDGQVRLVVYDETSQSFIVTKIIEAKKVLELDFNFEIYNKSALKYKYQIKGENSKWVDIGKGYNYLFRLQSNQLFDGFKFSVKDKENVKLLIGMKDGEIGYFTRNLLSKYYYYFLESPNEDKIKRIRLYLKSFSNSIINSDNRVAHVYAQITLLTDYVEKKTNEDNETTDNFSDIQWLNKKIEEYGFNYSIVGLLTGSLVAKGHISSLYDRLQTYEYYQQALKEGEGFIENFLPVDALSTYYPSVDKENTSFEIIDYDIREKSPVSTINICFSTDIKYFQMFAASWAQSSFHFNQLTLSFGIVTNNEEEYKFCLFAYESLLKSMASLMNTDIPNNYKFFWIKSKIINTTVYACARFYLAQYLLKNHDEDVFISDIDQILVGNFEDYLKKVKKTDYSVLQPLMRGYFSLLPGRSHLAGNIYLRNDSYGIEYCTLMTDYVGLGFEENNSWILDQNATRYAAEKVIVEDLNKYGNRAVRQFPELKTTLRKILE
ncbi:hypothetical protein [uncultured Psychrobacter sp.]|uniref:hypothetical protein n=1 Tax=uncultured Psychrobacter sp. TaxID=259303 RepID=UPI003457881C